LQPFGNMTLGAANFGGERRLATCDFYGELKGSCHAHFLTKSSLKIKTNVLTYEGLASTRN
jgi:hypothetical protein